VFRLLRPPRPSLFPYTTLFRSLGFEVLVGGAELADQPDVLRQELRVLRAQAVGLHRPADDHGELAVLPRLGDELIDAAGVDRLRSEEHTSELQSRVDLVCRLLL